MLTKNLTVVNPSGLHLRPAGVLSQTAMKFKCDVIIACGEKRIIAKANSYAKDNLLHICGWRGNLNNLSVYTDYDCSVINWAVHAEEVPVAEGKKLFHNKCVIGGFGNMLGAIVGGLLLGVIETFLSAYVSSAYKDMIAYALLLLFLFVKPTGLFNERAIAD